MHTIDHSVLAAASREINDADGFPFGLPPGTNEKSDKVALVEITASRDINGRPRTPGSSPRARALAIEEKP